MRNKLLLDEALCFDDVLLIPQFSDVESRSQVDLTTQLESHSLKYPVVSANMDTVTGHEMFLAMRALGAFGYIHRFMSYEERISLAPSCAMSIGISEEEIELGKYFISSGCTDICIDIAHGHSRAMNLAIIELRKHSDDVRICAGNVATREGALSLIRAGADIIKVGIGPGQVCTTRVVTGHGYPQLSAIANVASLKDDWNFHLIADGGIRNSGDIVKALAAGADSVMLGSLLAGCDEAPGERLDGKKLYRGMASISAQQHRPGNHRVRAAEGVSGLIEETGPVADVIDQLMQGVQSGCSYSGAHNLSELRENALFVKVTPTSLSESRARL